MKLLGGKILLFLHYFEVALRFNVDIYNHLKCSFWLPLCPSPRSICSLEEVSTCPRFAEGKRQAEVYVVHGNQMKKEMTVGKSGK